MPELADSRVLVIGGAGFIGSHIVDQLLDEPVREIVVLDNFARGARHNLDEALKALRLIGNVSNAQKAKMLAIANKYPRAMAHLAETHLQMTGRAGPRQRGDKDRPRRVACIDAIAEQPGLDLGERLLQIERSERYAMNQAIEPTVGDLARAIFACPHRGRSTVIHSTMAAAVDPSRKGMLVACSATWSRTRRTTRRSTAR